MHPNALAVLLQSLPLLTVCVIGLLVVPRYLQTHRRQAILVMVALATKLLVGILSFAAMNWMFLQIDQGKAWDEVSGVMSLSNYGGAIANALLWAALVIAVFLPPTQQSESDTGT
jgi:hypothetical protein